MSEFRVNGLVGKCRVRSLVSGLQISRDEKTLPTNAAGRVIE